MDKKYNQGVADSNRRRTKHGGAVNARQGGYDPIYNIWRGVKQRCHNPNSEHFHRYGGRGITMYADWINDFEAFKAYMGDRPEGTTLDRIDNSKGYEPNNVRWVTRKQQANNRDTNVVLTYDGKTMTLRQWADHLGWKYGLLASRWKKGLRDAQLFAPPNRVRGKLYLYNGENLTVGEIAKRTGIPYSTVVYKIKEGTL